jgi:hypothetical protein
VSESSYTKQKSDQVDDQGLSKMFYKGLPSVSGFKHIQALQKGLVILLMPEHALLASECTSSDELNSLCTEFLDSIHTEIPYLPQRPMVSSVDLFKRMLRERSTIRLLTKFAHEVLELFDAVPVYVSENAVFQ